MGVNDSKDRYAYFVNQIKVLAIQKELERINLLISMNKGLVTVNYPYNPKV